MMMSLLFLLPSAIIGMIQFVKSTKYYPDQEVLEELHQFYTTNGIVLLHFPTFALVILFGGVTDALLNWHDCDKSSSHLMKGWLSTIILSFIPAFVPLHYQLKMEQTDPLWKAQQVYAALWYMKELLPFIITFPTSLMRGALRIRGLIPFPASSLAGWVIFMTAPFQSLFVLFSFTIILQLNPSITLIVATVLMIISPWLYILRAELYVCPLNEETERRIVLNHRILLALTVSSVVLLIIWATAATIFDIRLLGFNADDCIVTYSSLGPLILESIGRIFITTVIFADLILECSAANWLVRVSHEQNQDEASRNEIKDEFGPLFASLGWEMPNQV